MSGKFLTDNTNYVVPVLAIVLLTVKFTKK